MIKLEAAQLAARIKQEVQAEIERMVKEHDVRPGLAAVRVGEDPASAVYVRNKIRACEEVGIRSEHHALPESTTTSQLLDLIVSLNARDDVDGILTQLPLPRQIDETAIIEAIDPAKDVDGFHPISAGKLAMGRPVFVPCTPAGIIELLDDSGVEIRGANACVVGRSQIVGRPMAQLLLQGTNFVNFMGRYVYVAADDALEVVVATEQSEPQAVFGSTLQKIAYPSNYDRFVRGGSELKEVYEHVGNPKVLQVQLRGEYAYVAAGEGGLRVYDVAQIDQKGFSERIVTAPVSRFGQKFWVKTKYATAVAAPVRNRPSRSASRSATRRWSFASKSAKTKTAPFRPAAYVDSAVRRQIFSPECKQSLTGTIS